MTLCFTPGQALLAAKAGAYIISPFVGRLDDIGLTGTDLIRSVVTIYKNYGYKTQVLAASMRSPTHIIDCALAGSHIATMPLKVLDMLFSHPLTDEQRIQDNTAFVGMKEAESDRNGGVAAKCATDEVGAVPAIKNGADNFNSARAR